MNLNAVAVITAICLSTDAEERFRQALYGDHARLAVDILNSAYTPSPAFGVVAYCDYWAQRTRAPQ